MTNDNNEHPAPSTWLSVQAAASELEVTTRTIYRFINDGKLAAYRIGRVYRIRRSDLDSFLVSAALRPGDLDHLVDDGRSARARHDPGDGSTDGDRVTPHRDGSTSSDGNTAPSGGAGRDGQMTTDLRTTGTTG